MQCAVGTNHESLKMPLTVITQSAIKPMNKERYPMRLSIKFALCIICLLLAITGCSSIPSVTEKEPIENTAYLKIGRNLEVCNTNENLILYDYKEALAGDGLYYASWKIGDAIPYENSDGDTVDLYDAQLYLLLGAFTSADKAQENEAE